MAKIFITGSTDGLGFLTAKKLLEEGDEVVLHARNQQRAQDVLKKLPSVKHVVIGNLSSTFEVKKIAEQVNQLGNFDVVIYNAGVSTSDTHLTFQVNDVAPYILTSLINRPKRIIYICSGMHIGANLDLKNLPETTNYSSSKLQLLLLSKFVARSWKNVIVSSVDPGWVPTKMGGPAASDDLTMGYTSQVWLASTTDKLVSGEHYYHMKPANYDQRADAAALQEQYLQQLAALTSVEFPS